MTLPHSADIFSYPARFQFGQSGAPCGGSSCCTDTCVQMIVEYFKERTYSLATIRKLAQAKTSFDERPCTGINSTEVLNALTAMGVTQYKAAFGIDANFVYNKLQYGPVIAGVHYGSYPTKAGKCSKAGIRNAEQSGKTDCSFNGAHAVLVIGKRLHQVTPTSAHFDVYVRDPDHNSPARPEKPAWDIIKLQDLVKAMNNLPTYTAFSKTYCIYSTAGKKL